MHPWPRYSHCGDLTIVIRTSHVLKHCPKSLIPNPSGSLHLRWAMWQRGLLPPPRSTHPVGARAGTSAPSRSNELVERDSGLARSFHARCSELLLARRQSLHTLDAMDESHRHQSERNPIFTSWGGLDRTTQSSSSQSPETRSRPSHRTDIWPLFDCFARYCIFAWPRL